MTLSVYVTPSHIRDKGYIYDILLESYNYVGAGAQIGFLTGGSDNWYDKAYNFPEFGVGVWFQPYAGALEFKNGSSLGNMLNLYGYGSWNLLRGRVFSLGPMTRLGIALTDRKYNQITNPYNYYIGANLEYLVSIGLEASVRLSDKFSVNLSALAAHHSNGMQSAPNWGIDELCFNFGAKYHLGGAATGSRQFGMPKSDAGRPVIENKLTVSPYLAAGIHSCAEIWYERGKQGSAPVYQRIMAGACLTYRYHPIFSSGVGLDLTYTTNIGDLQACDRAHHWKEYDSIWYCPVYCGVNAFQQFHYRQFEIHFRQGIYVFKELGITEDYGRRSYQKLGFSYSFSNNLYLGLDLLVLGFFGRADCLEFSIGYHIPLR